MVALLDACALVGAAFCLYALWAYRGRYLPRFLEDEPAPEGPLSPLTVIVPARNEAHRVEQAVRSLLAQRYPDLRVVAVDDRSTDCTGVILDRLQREDPRLRVVHVEALPPGWLGKPHALHVGLQEAQGEWVLLTDGDVVFAPDALGRAVGYAERVGVDHLAVFPRLELRTAGERAVVAVFGLLFGVRQRLGGVPDPRDRGHIGIGAFNLVRRRALEAIGGFEGLRLAIADDVELGQRIKGAGFRQTFLFSRGAVRLRWQEGVRGFVEGLMKNAFVATGFSVPRTVLVALGVLASNSVAPLAVFSPTPWARWCGAWVWLCLGVAYGVMHYLGTASFGLVLLHPVASLVIPYVLVRSMVRAYLQGGIQWRGTLYPLEWFQGR